MHQTHDHRLAILFHIRRYLPRPLGDFIIAEAAGGIALLVAAVCALIWANLAPSSYASLWSGYREIINEGFMTVFFLVVGLEIKREFVKGELKGIKTALLPILAAIGGMIVPALIYFRFNAGGAGSPGWAIPMATDIVFAAAVLTLLGKVVPSSLKLFLLVLAIVDDIGAIFVIGLFYSNTISWGPLALAAGIIALTLWLRRYERFGVPLILVMTAALWFALHAAGVQASIAGAIIGLLSPAVSKRFDSFSVGEKLETLLYPVATFVIIPIFALANAGVTVAGLNFSGDSALPVAFGIFAGLLLGKFIGIAGVVWLSVCTGLAELPRGASWSQLIGTACVAGIGFTVAIFVADLSFPGASNLQAVAKFSILLTSVAAAIVGSLLLRRVAR